jgi:hypothetical protein
MQWVTMKHTGGKSLFLVTDRDSQMEIIRIPIAQVFQTVSSPITLRRCTGSTLLKSVKRDTIKL